MDFPRPVAPSEMPGQPTPSSTENVSEVSEVQQHTLRQSILAKSDVLRDELAEFGDEVGGDGDVPREELLEMARSMQAELEIVATLLEHYPEESDE